MTAKEIVRRMIKIKGTTQQLVAERAGLKRQSNLSEMLQSRNMRVDNLVRLCNAMDCELIVKSKTSVLREDGSGMYKPEFIVEIEDGVKRE